MDRLNNQHKAINPQMVSVAREARGIPQETLADALKVTQGRVSKMEAGLLPIPSDLVDALARILHYPPHFFYQDGPLLGPGIPEFYHRKRQSVPKKLLEMIYAQMNIRRLQVTALLRGVDIPCTVPRIDPEEYAGDIEEVARLMRASLYLPAGPIRDVTTTLEDAGVLLLPFDFGTNQIDAISQWVPHLPPLVFINAGSLKDRYRFSLAHELGHMVLHAAPNPDIEKQANRFAAEFLVPAREARADLRDLTLEKLARLKPYWKVSMAMLLQRATDLGTVTANQARYLWAQMTKAGYKTREPVDLDIDGEQPRLFHELIETYLQQLSYTPSDLGTLVSLCDDEFRATYLQRRRASPLRVMPAPYTLTRDTRNA